MYTVYYYSGNLVVNILCTDWYWLHRLFCSLVNEARKVTSKIRLSDFFFKTDIVQRKDNYDNFLRGLLTQHSQEQDQFFTKEVNMCFWRYYRKIMKKLSMIKVGCHLSRPGQAFTLIRTPSVFTILFYWQLTVLLQSSATIYTIATCLWYKIYIIIYMIYCLIIII